MTIHTHMPTQAELIAIRMRVGRYDKPPKPIKHQFAWIRPEPLEHVRAWNAWKVTQADHVMPVEYIKALCAIEGITLQQVHRRHGKRWLVTIRDRIIQQTADRFPRLSSVKLGQLFQRDHTVILYCLGKVREKTKKHRSKLTLEDIIEIRRRASTKTEMGKDIAKDFGISSTSVSNIVRGKRWRVEMTERAA